MTENLPQVANSRHVLEDVYLLSGCTYNLQDLCTFNGCSGSFKERRELRTESLQNMNQGLHFFKGAFNEK